MYTHKQDEVDIEYKFMMDLILKKDYSVEDAKRTVKELFSEDKPKVVEGRIVTGNFEKALSELIRNIKNNNMSSSDLLYNWDRTRGTDWFTSTKLLESKLLEPK